MTFSELDLAVSDALSREHFPLSLAILAAANAQGDFRYLKAFGTSTLTEDTKPVETDVPLFLASACKLVTSVAAMRCIEDGLIGLDEDVSSTLPEFKNLQVLMDFGAEGTVELESMKEPLTMSGIANLESSKVRRYYESLGKKDHIEKVMRYFTGDDADRAEILPHLLSFMSTLEVLPLMFQPGTAWEYGYGPDWAGRIIERLSGDSLEEYCQKHIFRPLSMSSTTFRYADHPDIKARLPELTIRTPTGAPVPTAPFWPSGPPDMGGSGLCSSAVDQLKLLTSLLQNDGKLLKPTTVDLMLDARLPGGDSVREGLSEWGDGGGIDHCLCGVVNLDTYKATGRSKGAVSFSGATSCYWWIDRRAGVCGFYGGHSLVARDQGASKKMYEVFEKTVYEHVHDSHAPV